MMLTLRQHSSPLVRTSFYNKMRFFVYILYSEKFDVFYKGQTQDIKQRLILHNNGKVSSTKRYLPYHS